MYKVIDNFLDDESYKNLNNVIKGGFFNWFVEKEDTDDNTKNLNGFFNHNFFNNHEPASPYFKTLIIPILEKLNICSIINIRANLSLRDKDTIESGLHTDNKSNSAYTAILFLTKCNAKTVLELPDKKINIESIENRMLIFKSKIKHKVIYHTDVHKRFVINFNFFYEE
mgnify:FL=1|tara:strand:+ start:2219 stop:2725 length:507 start_codon:yes stop_codon:yes gene_type:complete